MKTSFFYRLFFISLFIISCPSIFTESSENKPTAELQLEKEAFEELMVTCQKHTQEIGWCCQQILQTLCNNKEQYTITNKTEVIQTLKMTQGLTQEIDLHVYSKNTRDALIEAIILNNGLIHFLSHALTSEFKDCDIGACLEKIKKKSRKDISNEIIYTVIQKNDANIKELVEKIGTTGLTWYNVLHRKMKEYHVYDRTKKLIPVGLGFLALSCMACKINTNVPDDVKDCSWLTYWTTRLFGSAPSTSKIADTSNPNISHEVWSYKYINKENQIVRTYTPQTIYQSINTVADDLLGSRLAAIAPLFTIDFPGIANYCFGDSWSWTKNKYHEKTNNLDKFLNGSQPNQNLTQDGQEKVYFQDLVGCQELEALAEQLANFVEHPEYYERSKTESHRGILLYGPPQTGKSNFAKALRTLMQDRVGDSKKISFIDGNALFDANYPIEDIFYIASRMSPCILFFDEIDLIGGNREKAIENTGKLLRYMQGMDTSKQVIIIGATNRIEQLDKALLVDGRFGKQIFIDYPKYQHRKEFLESELAKRAISLDEEFIDHIAQETDDCSYNNLRRIITEAIIISSNEHRLVCQNDFEKTLDIEIRKIKVGSKNQSSQEEKEVIAAYQAGKAVMRHILSTDRQIVKITIEDVNRTIKSKKTGYAISIGEETNPENEKLASEKNESKIKFGEVFTKTTGDKKDLISDQEVKKECLVLLAGNIAQQIILQKTYSQCNKQDRADAMQTIYQGITQGEKIDEKVRQEALVIKDRYEQEIIEILKNNHELLIKIFEALTANTTIDRYQWAELVS